MLVLFVVSLFFACEQKIFTARPDPNILGIRYSNGRQVEEVRHRWNEISRVALMKFFWPEGVDEEGRPSEPEYRLIHDDGISNVIVRPYDPELTKRRRAVSGTHGIPFLLHKKLRLLGTLQVNFGKKTEYRPDIPLLITQIRCRAKSLLFCFDTEEALH